eukprot:g15913.t1
MSEVAIDTLRVDLTRLLLSARSCGPAKGRAETDQIAQTTSRFRRCKQTGDDGSGKESGSVDGGDGDEAPGGKKTIAVTPPRVDPVAAAASRRAPPQEVDSCCYAYAPLVDQKKQTAAGAEVEAQRAYRYADGFKPRRRRAQPSAGFTFSQNGDFSSRRWHEHSSSRTHESDERSSGEDHRQQQHGQHGQQRQQRQQRQRRQQQQQQQQQQKQQLEGPPEAAATPTLLSRGSGSSELHEFLYREGQSRTDRLRVKQAERDRELTFQPRLATEKYWAANARRRSRSASRNARGRALDVEAAEGATVDGAGGGDGRDTGTVAPVGTERRVQTRFEMLYQDSKAKLVRAQQDSLKIPAACTFQPRLMSHRPMPRGRHRQVARETRVAAEANIGGEAYVVGDSAEPGSERDGDETNDEPEGWVNRLVFCNVDISDGDSGRHRDPLGQGPGQAEQQQQQQDQEQEHKQEHQQEESHRHQQDDRQHYRCDGSHPLSPGGGVVVNGNGDRARDSCGRSRGRATSRIDAQEHRGGNNSSSGKVVTRRGRSEGAGQRMPEAGAAALVDETVSYAERLYRGHEEQQQVWEKRRQESARLELKDCTFRPRLDQRRQPRGQVGGRPRRSSSMVALRTASSSDGYYAETRSPAASAATHERLYRAAEQVRARRAEEVAAREMAETAGCTFHPAVNHGAIAADSARKPTHHGDAAPYSSTPRTRNGDYHGQINPTSKSRDASSSCVVDRLLAAGKEAERRRAMLGKMPPPGCTFRPQARDVTLLHSVPNQTFSYTKQAQDGCPVTSYHTNHVVSYGAEGAKGGSGSGGSGARSDIGGSDIVAEADGGRGKIPYRESRFSPRRGRRKREAGGRVAGDVGDGGEVGVGISSDGRESPACERLFELGDRAQRKRNDAPRDTPKTQRERDELEELKLCTFAPVMFTKAYRRPRPKARHENATPTQRKEEDGTRGG